jgi:lipopolysaccharide export system protein LptA
MTARPATARIRRILLVCLILVTAAIAALYLFGRQGAAPVPEPQPLPVVAAQPDVVAVSDAFDFTQSIEGKPVFSIHGDSFSTARDSHVELAGVRVELYRGEEKYAVASRMARYDPNTREAELSGGVTLEGRDGLRVTSEILALSRGGELLEAKGGAVGLEQTGKWRGQSTGLVFDVPADVLKLTGPVRIDSVAPGVPPMTFEAALLEYDRKGQLLRIPGVLNVTRGGDRFQAGNGELFFAGEEGRPQLLSLKGGVAGTLVDPELGAPGRRLALQATRLSLRFAADSPEGESRPEEATLEGHDRDLALVESIGGDADLIQGLASRAWRITFASGVPSAAESSDPVHFAEYRRGVDEAVRSGRADNGRIEFSAAGEVERIVLAGDVALADAAFKAWGDRVLFDVASGRAEILGPKSRIESARADLSAPHLVYMRETGVLNATEGVRAVLKKEEGGALSGLGWAGDAPVQIEAREATLTDRPRTFAFRENVRAWQGRNLLIASQLRGSDEDRQLSAAGGVKTVWVPETTDATPVEVTAEAMAYSESMRKLVYSGGVRLKQAERTMAASELAAELGDDSKIRRMTATGKVELRDPATGQEISGQGAEYDVASGVVVVTGEPVTMKDPQGAVLTGRRLTYDMKSGAAKLGGSGS